VADQLIACECGKKLRVDARHAGKVIRCPGCRRTFAMPATVGEDLSTVLPAVLPDPQDEREDKIASAPRSGKAARPAVRRQEEVLGDDDVEPIEDERPRPRQKRRRRPARTGNFLMSFMSLLAVRSFRGPLVVGVLAVVLLSFAFMEARLKGEASDTPQTLPLAKLAANGPGDNAHVIITDFTFCDQILEKHKTVNLSRWEEVYVPVVPWAGGPKRAQAGAPGTIRVIVHSTKVHNQQDLERVFGAPTLQGTVVNSIRSLDRETQDLLSSRYGPGVGSWYILQEGRKPFSAGLVILMTVGGTLLLVLSGLMVVARMLFND
jgi:hypothetical protein